MKVASRSLLTVSLIAFTSALSFSAASAETKAEGRVSDAPAPALNAERNASYSSAPASATEVSDMAKAGIAKQAKAATKEYRASTDKSSRASFFRIYDAGRVLITDRDGDGYRSEFRIRFDADVTVGDALVYAKLYLRRVGDTGAWQLYHTTDDFWIYNQSGSDDYFVNTTLDEGFPTADYDVLIDLYESGYSGIVATIDAYDTSVLGYLPLEETGLDVPIALPGYAISDVTTSLIIDDDSDGFYSRFRITFDPDTDFGSSYVYAIVWVRPQGGTWIKEHESADFRADISGSADAYSVTADWVSGYPTANYDVQIDLYEAASGLLVASAGSDRDDLSLLPLEDQARDRYVNPPSNGGGGGHTSSDEHGGGATSIWFALALAALALGRKLRSIQKVQAAVAVRARRRE